MIFLITDLRIHRIFNKSCIFNQAIFLIMNYKLLICLFLILSSCNCDDEELQLQRMEYSGNEIKLDGYYFTKHRGELEGVTTVFFFYRNGVVHYGGGFSTNIEERIEDFKTDVYNNSIKDVKYKWGIFLINGGEIEFERWAPNINSGGLKTEVWSGPILDDETFVATSYLDNYSGKTTAINDTFHFVQFSPKPDSTNMFIP